MFWGVGLLVTQLNMSPCPGSLWWVLFTIFWHFTDQRINESEKHFQNWPWNYTLVSRPQTNWKGDSISVIFQVFKTPTQRKAATYPPSPPSTHTNTQVHCVNKESDLSVSLEDDFIIIKPSSQDLSVCKNSKFTPQLSGGDSERQTAAGASYRLNGEREWR